MDLPNGKEQLILSTNIHLRVTLENNSLFAQVSVWNLREWFFLYAKYLLSSRILAKLFQ